MSDPVWEICPECDGSGELDWLTGELCHLCRGRGLVEDDVEYGPAGDGDGAPNGR